MFFDFHCHPVLKTQFTDAAHPIQPWENIKATIDIPPLKGIGINNLFNEILNSQSSLTALCQSVKLFGLVLHAPEANMAKGLASQAIVQRGEVKQLNFDRIQYIATGLHSYSLIKEELQKIEDNLVHNGYKLVILTNNTVLAEHEAGTIYGFISVEGLHCFFNDTFDENAFNQNFESFTAEHTIFAINVCHLQQNPFCNHAHGIQIFNDKLFYPTGNGITEWGRRIVERLAAKKILIDTKHTSLKSRLQLYAMLKDDSGNYSMPIVCTHTGVTGLSINDRVKYICQSPLPEDGVYQVSYYKPQSAHLTDTYYNCTSINLYDEDIIEILRSGGMIGLSFDQRILGFANENVLRNATFPQDYEYISKAEASFFLGPSPENLPIYNQDSGVWTSEDFENTEPAMNSDLHFRFFFNNIFHILDVAKIAGMALQTVSRQICIGSDFDGLINAIDCCKTAEDLPGFKVMALNKLPALLHEANLQHDIIDVNEFADNLFYINGRDFVLKVLEKH